MTMGLGARIVRAVAHPDVEVAREVSVADAQDHRGVAGSRLCGPLTAHYGEERQGGRRDGRGCGTWTRSLKPSSGEWAVLPDGVLGLIAAGGCVYAVDSAGRIRGGL
jgi:hypothetical protein